MTLVRSSYHLTGRKDVAEDIVQDLFVYLWERQADVNLDHPFTYLRRATISRTINWIKREQRIDLTDHHEDPVPVVEAGTEVSDLHHRLDAVREAIAALPPKCGLIFRLNRFEGLTMAEIAEYLSISPNTVENQIGKALKLLRNQLKSRQAR